MKTQTQSTEEIKLQEKVRLMATGVIVEYLPEMKLVRELGNTVLLVHSCLEGDLEELITAHLEGWSDRVSISVAVEAFMKYQPLLAKMFFLGKLSACKEYGYLSRNKKDTLVKLLGKINIIRDQFAHYQCYKYKLENEYQTVKARIRVLTDMQTAMDLINKKKNQLYSKSLT